MTDLPPEKKKKPITDRSVEETDPKPRRRKGEVDLIKRKNEADLKKTEIKSKINCLWPFFLAFLAAGKGSIHRRRGRREDLPAALLFFQRRVSPRAASGGGAWSRHATTVQLP